MGRFFYLSFTRKESVETFTTVPERWTGSEGQKEKETLESEESFR